MRAKINSFRTEKNKKLSQLEIMGLLQAAKQGEFYCCKCKRKFREQGSGDNMLQAKSVKKVLAGVEGIDKKIEFL